MSLLRKTKAFHETARMGIKIGNIVGRYVVKNTKTMLAHCITTTFSMLLSNSKCLEPSTLIDALFQPRGSGRDQRNCVHGGRNPRLLSATGLLLFRGHSSHQPEESASIATGRHRRPTPAAASTPRKWRQQQRRQPSGGEQLHGRQQWDRRPSVLILVVFLSGLVWRPTPAQQHQWDDTSTSSTSRWPDRAG